jgi:hypothetical protein
MQTMMNRWLERRCFLVGYALYTCLLCWLCLLNNFGMLAGHTSYEGWLFWLCWLATLSMLADYAQ